MYSLRVLSAGPYDTSRSGPQAPTPWSVVSFGSDFTDVSSECRPARAHVTKNTAHFNGSGGAVAQRAPQDKKVQKQPRGRLVRNRNKIVLGVVGLSSPASFRSLAMTLLGAADGASTLLDGMCKVSAVSVWCIGLCRSFREVHPRRARSPTQGDGATERRTNEAQALPSYCEIFRGTRDFCDSWWSGRSRTCECSPSRVVAGLRPPRSRLGFRPTSLSRPDDTFPTPPPTM